MKIWLVLLLLSFVAGGRNLRRDRPERALVVLVVCLLVAVALSTRRFA